MTHVIVDQVNVDLVNVDLVNVELVNDDVSMGHADVIIAGPPG